MKDYRQLLLSNRAWAAELTDENPEFFSRQVAGQNPDFLWIGCSDSRVSPEQMTQSLPGSIYIHRNLANLVDPDDNNLMAVVQNAIDVLGVKHIILCGHYGCSGVIATLEGDTTGPINEWLAPAREVYRDHAQEIDGCPTEESRVNRFVEVNVCDQLVRLAQTDIVQAAFARGQELWLHGWVYDLRDGLIKPMMEIDGNTVLEDVGRPEKVLV